MLRVPLQLVADADDASLASCFVEVVVDGRPTPALLDSGASRSAVVGKLPTAGDPEPPTGGGVFGGRAAPSPTMRVELSIAGRSFGAVAVEVVAPDHPGHGNLVGQDVLGRGCIEYRLGAAELTLDAPPPIDGHAVRVGRRGHVLMDVAWPDGTHALAVFDTGASITVVDSAFASAHPDLFAPDGESQGMDADGHIVPTPMVQIAPVTILGSSFARSAGALVDLSAANDGAEFPMDMILGWPLLRQGTFTIDHRRGVARHRFGLPDHDGPGIAEPVR